MNRKLLGNALIVAAGIIAGALLARQPIQEYLTHKSTANKAQIQMREIEARREALAMRKVQLESPVGREQEAREHGFKRADETPIEVE